MTPYIIGDSHTRTYNGRDRKKFFRGATAHNILRDGGKSRKKLLDILDNIDKDEHRLIFLFGEIDCRVHLHHRGVEGIYNTVNNYVDAILMAKEKMCVGVHCVIPTVEHQPDILISGNTPERVMVTNTFNQMLSWKLNMNDVPFFTLPDKYKESDGTLRKDYTSDGVHIDPELCDIKNEFLEWFNSLKGGHDALH